MNKFNVDFLAYCLCFGDFDVDRVAVCDDAFFGVPF